MISDFLRLNVLLIFLVFIFNGCELNVNNDMSVMEDLTMQQENYNFLSTNDVSSENYEVIKLVNGVIDGVLYNKKNHMTFVLADNYIWKIDTNGYLVDTFHRASKLYSSGLILLGGGGGFSDWVYSGNKSVYKYTNIIDMNDKENKEFMKAVESSDIVEFSSFKIKDEIYGMVGIFKNNNKWRVYDITSFSKNIHLHCDNGDSDLIKINCFGDYDKDSFSILKKLENSLSDSIGIDDKGLLSINDFDKKFYYYEEGVKHWALSKVLKYTLLSGYRDKGGWPTSYWYGISSLNFKINNEILKFKALVPEINNRVYFDDIFIFALPENLYPDVKFLYISPIESYVKNKNFEHYNNKESGFYVIRKKEVFYTQSKIIHKKNSTYNLRRPWKVEFSGVKSLYPIFGDVQYYNSEINSSHYLLNEASAKKYFKFIPKRISFSWVKENRVFAYKLYLQGDDYIWLDLNIDDFGALINIELDESEIVEAFKVLYDVNDLLNLYIDIQEVDDFGGRLRLTLANNTKTIELKKSKFNYNYRPLDYGNDAEVVMKFERLMLQIEFNRVISNVDYLQDYINLSQSIVNNSVYAKEYAYQFANYTTKLLLKALKIKDYEMGKLIFYHYVNSVLPIAGHHEKTSDIASIALAMSIEGKIKEISDMVFLKIIGSNYDVKKLSNEILLFNLACYYATYREKNLMLDAIKQAKKLGKKANEFKSEIDFKYYWQDKDFINTLK